MLALTCTSFAGLVFNTTLYFYSSMFFSVCFYVSTHNSHCKKYWSVRLDHFILSSNSEQVRNLDVTMNPELNFTNHITILTKTAFLSHFQSQVHSLHLTIYSECCSWSTYWDKKTENITPMLKTLPWLPVKYRIDFKILLRALNGLAPAHRLHTFSNPQIRHQSPNCNHGLK